MRVFNGFGAPTGGGVYLVEENGSGDKNVEVSVYLLPARGLCVFVDDTNLFDLALPGEFSDGHIPVYYSELNFIKKVGELRVE